MNQTETRQSRTSDLLGRTVRDAETIGKTWARYGLIAGKNALETGAVKLGKVADVLNNLATNLKDESNTIIADRHVVDEATETSEANDASEGRGKS